MNDLKNYQSILSDKAGRVETFFKKYPAESAELGKNFADINATKIRKTEPEIMVYGIYNAGKSSILNELIGEDKAKVEDKPTTDSVTYYDWQGYKIADTPGVFAPIEHEEVTEAHLKKADVVLFVMSADGLYEHEENYKRMKKIAAAGKKIIIVLNDKDGDLGKRDENIQEIKRKVAVNMKRVGIENVDEKYCIVTVNALRAHKGREKNKPLLIAQSGFDELKDVILSELKRTTSFEILRGGISQLENILEEFIRTLEAHENSELLRKMGQVLESFNRQKISMRREINTYIDTKAEILGESLPQIIWANRDKKNQLNAIMGEEVAKLNAKVQREIERQLQETATILELEMQSFAEIKIDSSSVDAESLKNILAQLDSLKAQPIQALTEKKSGDSIFAPVTAQIAGQLAKSTFIKSILPNIPPVIIVGAILTLFKFLGDNSEREKEESRLAAQNEAERRRVEAEMQARQELNQKCRYLADNLADELKTAADNSVKEILAEYEKPFKAEIEARKAEGEQVTNDILSLRELHDEYDLLRVELGAR